MEIKDKREKEEVPSGIRLMLLLKERLVEGTSSFSLLSLISILLILADLLLMSEPTVVIPCLVAGHAVRLYGQQPLSAHGARVG